MLRHIVSSLLCVLLLAGCTTTRDTEIERQDEYLSQTDVDVLVINAMTEEYPAAGELWSELILERVPQAKVEVLEGDVASNDVRRTLSLFDGELAVVVYQGHGNVGNAWFGGEDYMPWQELVNSLAQRHKPFVLVVDACFSGSVADAFKGIALDAPAMLLTSCGAEETSNGRAYPSRPEWSVSWLLRSLLLFKKVPSQLEGEEICQHPELWRFNSNTGELEQLALNPPHPMKADKRFLYLM